MQQLPLELKKNGFIYKQMQRNSNAAIYAQYDKGVLVAYEVFEVRKQKAGSATFEGQEVEFDDKEKFPSDKAFGYHAFSFMPNQWDEALSKYTELTKKAEAKPNRNQ